MDEQRLVDIELERKVLSGILADPNVIIPLHRALLPDDFSDDKHRVIFEVMLQLFKERVRPSVDNVLLRLEDLEWLHRAGDEGYLVGLESAIAGLGIGSTIDVPVWGERLAGLADRRRLRGFVARVDSLALNMKEDPRDIKQHVLSAIVDGKQRLDVGEYRLLGDYADDAGRLVTSWYTGDRTDVVPTGIARLDFAIGGGLAKYQYTIVGARPGMGKTLLVENILRYAEKRGQVCGFASLEMRGEDLAVRDILRLAGVDGLKLRQGLYTEDEDILSKLQEATDIVSQRKTLVNDNSSQTAADMQIAAHLMKIEQGKLDLFAIDYLELMGDAAVTDGSGDNARVGVVIANRRIKALAKSVGCATIGLSQVTKAGAINPTLRCLMFGGESEADLVLMPYWPWKLYADNESWKAIPEMVLVDGKPKQEDWILRIAKGRFCQVGYILLKVKAEIGLITDPDYSYDGGD